MDIFLPLLKNDFKLAETSIVDKINPLDINISIFLGHDDDLTMEQCQGWREYTNQKCDFHFFEGGHFFIHEKAEDIVSIINSTLEKKGVDSKP